MKSFGERLLQTRKRAGLTQEELGEKVGVGGSYISRLERGIYQPPSREVTVKLADALGLREKARLDFLHAAEVGSDKDLEVEGFRLVKVEDDKAVKSNQQAISSLSPSDLLAATGTFGSPDSLVDDQEQQQPTFEEQVRQIVTSAHLPYDKRMIAQKMILEASRIICWGLKEAE
jgi:transcriptional regulator with XRE-family HTH domain